MWKKHGFQLALTMESQPDFSSSNMSIDSVPTFKYQGLASI